MRIMYQLVLYQEGILATSYSSVQFWQWVFSSLLGLLRSGGIGERRKIIETARRDRNSTTNSGNIEGGNTSTKSMPSIYYHKRAETKLTRGSTSFRLETAGSEPLRSWPGHLGFHKFKMPSYLPPKLAGSQ